MSCWTWKGNNDDFALFRYRQIAAGSPQWPQAFYPMKKINTVEPGEVVTARYVASFPTFFSSWIFLLRCSYNSTGVNHETHIGGTAGDEMCNLYIMYFTGKLCTIIQLLVLSGALYVAISMGQTHALATCVTQVVLPCHLFQRHSVISVSLNCRINATHAMNQKM